MPGPPDHVDTPGRETRNEKSVEYEVDVLDANDEVVGTARFVVDDRMILVVRWSGVKLAGFRAWSDA